MLFIIEVNSTPIEAALCKRVIGFARHRTYGERHGVLYLFDTAFDIIGIICIWIRHLVDSDVIPFEIIFNSEFECSSLARGESLGFGYNWNNIDASMDSFEEFDVQLAQAMSDG